MEGNFNTMTIKKMFSSNTIIKATNMKQTSPQWIKLPVLILIVAIAVVLFTMTAFADSSSSAPTNADSVQAPAVATPPPVAIFLSPASNGEIDDNNNATGKEINFKDEDILRCVPTGNECTWDLYFDGSDVGLGRADLEDFEILDNGHILFTIDRSLTLPGIGLVKRSDVIEFTPITLGPHHTSGTFSVFLRGSDVGLTKSGENIDALARTPSGNLVVSLEGTGKVPKVGGGELTVQDEDLIELIGGAWQLYFDGSTVGLTSGSEDVAAAWIDPNSPDHNLYLTTKGNFSVHSVNSLTGKKTDVFGCSPTSSNPITSCFFFKFFNAKIEGFTKGIDGLFVLPTTAVNSAALATIDSSAAATPDAGENVADPSDVTANDGTDNQIDVYDSVDIAEEIYLPMIAGQ